MILNANNRINEIVEYRKNNDELDLQYSYEDIKIAKSMAIILNNIFDKVYIYPTHEYGFSMEIDIITEVKGIKDVFDIELNFEDRVFEIMYFRGLDCNESSGKELSYSFDNIGMTEKIINKLIK